MAEKKKHSLVDKVLHPKRTHDEDEAEREQKAQENYEDQGPAASTPAPEKPKPEPRRGKANRDPAVDYQNHPKFSKFKRGT